MTEETTMRFDDEKTFRAAVKRTITWFRDKRIRLLELPLEIEHAGVTLRGRLYYWSKDWFVVLEEPVYTIGPGLHMLYMAPAKYVAPGQEPGDGVHGVKLPGAEALVELYERVLLENTP